MKREIIETSDGSKTIRIVDLDENYHSGHGALQEAEHVFISAGLKAKLGQSQINIFEVGFGTGLNAFLTAIEVSGSSSTIYYEGIEAFPVQSDEISALNYRSLKPDFANLYDEIHAVNWEEFQHIHTTFHLKKIKQEIQTFSFEKNYLDIVYFDAFGPRAQEEMWTVTIFEQLYQALKKGGLLVTYCAKGQVKRDLKAVGFDIEALPGPPGKREMTRAWKR